MSKQPQQSMQSLLLEFQTILQIAVIKDNKRAIENETSRSKYYANQYIAAVSEKSSYYTYTMFSEDVMKEAGFTDKEIAYYDTKEKIPQSKIPLLIKLQDEKTKREYIEENNYYRMLMGIPDFGDNHIIFAPDEFYNNIEIDPIAIHLLTKDQVLLLDKDGYLDEIKKEYPEREYLNHLGYSSVDVYSARIAPDFTCLNIDPYKIESFIHEEFSYSYESSREYHMTTIYNKDMAKSIPFYRNFLGFSIMFYSLQMLITNSFKYNISRDFLDLPTIKLFYDAYKIPFVNSLKVEQHKEFAKNVNYLLQYKSTDAVMHELFKIFGVDNFVLYKYYLIKQREYDELGNPVFIYKNEDGKKVLDLDQIYKFHFQMVDSRVKNLAKAFTDINLRQEYHTVTSTDPYWVEDAHLKDKLLKSKFNYMETKYLGLSIMYKYTEIMFDTQYAVSMLMDQRPYTDRIMIEIPKLFGVYPIDLFGVSVLLQGLFCKKLGYNGKIKYTADQICKVYGFNFKENTNEVRKALLENPLCDDRLKHLVKTKPLNNAKAVDSFFLELKEFDEILDSCTMFAKTKEEYKLYDTIFKVLMVRDCNRTCFTMSNGEEATYIGEFLEDYDKKLFNVFQSVIDDEIDETMSFIIDAVVEAIPSMMEMYNLADTSSKLIDSILTLMIYFKSYTTDIIKGDIAVVFDSLRENLNKYMDDIHWTEREFNINYTKHSYDLIHNILNELYGDNNTFVQDVMYNIDNQVVCDKNILLKEILDMYIEMYHNKDIKLKEEFLWHSTLYLISKFKMTDYLRKIEADLSDKEILKNTHTLDLNIDETIKSASQIYDIIKEYYSEITSSYNFGMYDGLIYYYCNMDINSSVSIKDGYETNISLVGNNSSFGIKDYCDHIEYMFDRSDKFIFNDNIPSIDATMELIQGVDITEGIHNTLMESDLISDITIVDTVNDIGIDNYIKDILKMDDNTSLYNLLSLNDSLKLRIKMNIIQTLELISGIKISDKSLTDTTTIELVDSLISNDMINDAVLNASINESIGILETNDIHVSLKDETTMSSYQKLSMLLDKDIINTILTTHHRVGPIIYDTQEPETKSSTNQSRSGTSASFKDEILIQRD